MSFFDKFKFNKKVKKENPEETIMESSEEAEPLEESQEEGAEKIEEEIKEIEIKTEEKEKKLGLLDKLKFNKKDKENNPEENLKTIEVQESLGDTAEAEENKAVEEKKKGLFEKFKQGLSKTRKNLGGKIEELLKSYKKIDEEFFEELEDILIQADVGVKTSVELVENIKKRVKKEKISNTSDIWAIIKEEIREILNNNETAINILPQELSIILVVGVNGAGKTTSIAKIANRYKQEGKKVMVAAGDTFRAAAIEQLEIWTQRIDVELIKHQSGADPGAVVFDAISAAKARGADILIIDTAGRLQNKSNLMKEIGKVRKIIERELEGAPHEVLLVLDATTGQNAISQARLFEEATGVSGIILTKLDGTAKGGIVIAISRELDIPVKLVGIGEGIEDLREFSAEIFSNALFEEEEI